MIRALLDSTQCFSEQHLTMVYIRYSLREYIHNCTFKHVLVTLVSRNVCLMLMPLVYLFLL